MSLAKLILAINLMNWETYIGDKLKELARLILAKLVLMIFDKYRGNPY